METTHRVVVGDARDAATVADESVELVVTSPPYPMVEMWDDLFADLSPAAGDALVAGKGREAFDAMHDELDAAWAEVERVLAPGGIACINVGDATRKLDDTFRVYPNHARVIDAFEALGFDPLPDVLWRKPTNSGTKFMGSGMLPPSAYVTLEHEYVLVFRKGDRRRFEPGADRRYEAAYFWEERNRWFSDVWTDVTGEAQATDAEARERSAAFPFAIPYRLVNMYSVYGDTVLDPFWGTGTTSVAAMAAGRNSVGVEREPEFARAFEARAADAEDLSRRVARRRLADHRDFVRARREAGESFEYRAEHYDFPVITRQERRIRLYEASDVMATSDGYRARHRPVEE